MGLKCLINGHDTTSGEGRIAVEDLWRNTCVFWCKECDDVVVSFKNTSDRHKEKAVSAAEGVLDASDGRYDRLTKRAARKVVRKA